MNLFSRLQLRIRFIPTDFNEVNFKDHVSFVYYYEQVIAKKVQFNFNLKQRIFFVKKRLKMILCN